MMIKGEVSSVDTLNRKARVTFRDLDNSVSPEIPYAKNITLEVNDTVAVIFFTSNKSDGLIIAVY